jgi:UDP-N-acetylmuramate--alanine ligase
VVESDESDGSFLKLAPILAVVTNIDREHLDHYGSLERILDAFADFANKIPFYGAAVLCLDDEQVQRLIPRITRRTITYGTSAQADLLVREVHAGPRRFRFQAAVSGA